MKRLPKSLRNELIKYFVTQVREGKTPDRELMEYVADGLEYMLENDFKNWPSVKTTSQATLVKTVSAWAFEVAGIDRERAAELLEIKKNEDASGSDYKSNHRKLIQKGRELYDDPDIAARDALEYIFSDYRGILSDDEREQVKATIERLGGDPYKFCHY